MTQFPISVVHFLPANFFFCENLEQASRTVHTHQNYPLDDDEYFQLAKMGLFVLSETSAGFALFKARDKKILKDDLAAEVDTAEGLNGL